MLNPVQASIERSIRKGKSAVWITDRQVGKTYIAHHVAQGFGSVAYITPSYHIILNHKRNYENWRVQYFCSDNPLAFYGGKLRGFGLIVVDDFEHVPMSVLEYVRSIPPTQKLFLATRWGNFMTTPPVNILLRTNDDDLNALLMQLHRNKFDTFID